MITRKAGPALAAGCTMVVKPATADAVLGAGAGELAERAGVPAGVFNVVTGSAGAIGGEMTSNPIVRKLTFTGSTEIGKLLMAAMRRHGQENFAGTGRQRAVHRLRRRRPRCGGRRARSPRSTATPARPASAPTASWCRTASTTPSPSKLAEPWARMKVGDRPGCGAIQGPLIDMKAVEKVEEHIADAVGKGAKVVAGGKRHALGGSFFEPTVAGRRDARHDDHHARRPSGRSRRCSASRPKQRRSRWPTTPSSAWPPISTAATSAASGASPRRSNTASSASTTGIISTEVAPFGGVKESRHRPRRLEIRHRGVPRGQIPLHGRHRPLGSRCAASGALNWRGVHRARCPSQHKRQRGITTAVAGARCASGTGELGAGVADHRE